MVVVVVVVVVVKDCRPLASAKRQAATPEFAAWARTLFKRIGPYPAGFLTQFKARHTSAKVRMLCVWLYRSRVAKVGVLFWSAGLPDRQGPHGV
jgi:hypothetical protein